MLLSEVSRPFSRSGWGFEIKYDGWRCLAEVKKGTVRLQSRGGADLTTWWPEVAIALAGLRGHHVLTAKCACSTSAAAATSIGCRLAQCERDGSPG